MTEKKSDNNPAQPLLDATLKAFYVAAGVTDVLAERVMEFAEHQQEAARERRERHKEQISEQMNKATEAMKDPATFARSFPEQVQDQLRHLLEEMHLDFDEMAARGEKRISEVRGQAAEGARRTDQKASEAAEDVAETVEPDPAEPTEQDPEGPKA